MYMFEEHAITIPMVESFGDPGQKGHTVTHMIIDGPPSSSAHYHRDIPTINNSTDRQEVVGGSRVNAI
jgi:hypothetical protein